MFVENKMIGKFDIDFIDKIYDTKGLKFKKFICGEFACKFNEIIDVVNALVEENNIHEKQIDKLQMKQDDKYAEQKKWIGKLCRCWDSNIDGDVWGILQDIKDNKTEKYYLYGIGYEHCEPVRPDDSIICQGEQRWK